MSTVVIFRRGSKHCLDKFSLGVCGDMSFVTVITSEIIPLPSSVGGRGELYNSEKITFDLFRGS